ncbi:MAG: ATP-binding protein [Lachnospiraceae bacterium]
MVLNKDELKYLEERYQTEGNTLMVLYGREQIGKKAILQEFVRDKKYLYYCAGQASELEQKIMMRREIEEKCGSKIAENTYETFFNRLRSGNRSKLVFIIDRFELIVKKDPEFFKALVRLQEGKLYSGPVMTILCSSNISWIEHEMDLCLGEKAKKIQNRYKVSEINFLEMVRSFPEYSVRDCVQVYGVIGGVPGYIQRWDKTKGLKYNICKHILSEDGFLYGEAERFISTQLRELTVYNTILGAIASGRHKLNELYLYTGFSRAKISVYMKNLMAFEVVEKVSSLETGGWDNAQKGLYRIRNTYVNFWFRFIYPNYSDYKMLPPEEFYAKYMETELDPFLNRYFIKVCMEYLELMSAIDQLPIKIHKMGTWVGKKGTIDIIAQDKIRNNLVGMCNWSEVQFTFKMYEQLVNAMDMAKIKSNYIYLFSAKKFDYLLMDEAKKNKKLVLIDMNRL